MTLVSSIVSEKRQGSLSDIDFIFYYGFCYVIMRKIIILNTLNGENYEKNYTGYYGSRDWQ